MLLNEDTDRNLSHSHLDVYLSFITEYNPESCKYYKLFPSYDSMITTGPDPRAALPAQDTLSDEDSNEDEQSHEDHYALLVKAWEQKVFPVIRRRFRNEAERKDGLEQIKGALQLGTLVLIYQLFYVYIWVFCFVSCSNISQFIVDLIKYYSHLSKPVLKLFIL